MFDALWLTWPLRAGIGILIIGLIIGLVRCERWPFLVIAALVFYSARAIWMYDLFVNRLPADMWNKVETQMRR
jgi:hypothetical protein